MESDYKLYFWCLFVTVCLSVFFLSDIQPEDNRKASPAPDQLQQKPLPPDHSLITLSRHEYEAHQRILDSLMAQGEVRLLSDVDELRLSAAQSSLSTLLSIKHPRQIQFTDFPWYMKILPIFLMLGLLYVLWYWITRTYEDQYLF